MCVFNNEAKYFRYIKNKQEISIKNAINIVLLVSVSNANSYIIYVIYLIFS